MHSEEIVLENVGTATAAARLCPDCGTESSGDFCHNCGETVEPHLLSVRHYLREIFHEFLAFDSKFFRTLPALLFKPGYLTEEYIAGRRKKYLAPARLYVTVAFVSFFALGYYGNHLVGVFVEKAEKPNSNITIRNGTETTKESAETLGILIKLSVEVAPYVLLLVSTPAFAFLLRIIYARRKKFYVEHLMFSLHFFAFALILFMVTVVLPSLVMNELYLPFIGLIIFFVYLYFALRRFYGDHGFALVVRTAISSLSYVTIAGIAIIATLVVAAFIGVQMGELPSTISGNFSITHKAVQTPDVKH